MEDWGRRTRVGLWAAENEDGQLAAKAEGGVGLRVPEGGGQRVRDWGMGCRGPGSVVQAAEGSGPGASGRGWAPGGEDRG